MPLRRNEPEPRPNRTKKIKIFAPKIAPGVPGDRPYAYTEGCLVKGSKYPLTGRPFFLLCRVYMFPKKFYDGLREFPPQNFA